MVWTRKLVCGVGINDVDSPIGTMIDGERKMDIFYQTWKGMLSRCYNKNSLKRNPTYIGCTVCEDWICFSKFKRWMVDQDWEGYELDKDLLVGGNKIYSPSTCLFISRQINLSLTLRANGRGKYPLGCHYDRGRKRYCSQGGCGNGVRLNLGRYLTSLEAHRAWQLNRIKVLDELKDSQPDFLIKIGLQRIINKIQDDYDNNRETKDFN